MDIPGGRKTSVKTSSLVVGAVVGGGVMTKKKNIINYMHLPIKIFYQNAHGGPERVRGNKEYN